MFAWVARNWRAVILAAVLLDLIIAFGPPLLPSDGGPPLSIFAIMPRWFVMIVGIFAFVHAEKEGVISQRLFGNLILYLIFGFTAAGLLNVYLPSFFS